MARKNNRRKSGLQGQKWLTTSLSESARLLTATVAALELEAQSLMTKNDGFDVANNEESFGQEHVADAETSTPNPSSSDVSETNKEEFQSKDAHVDDSTTVAQQVEMHVGNNAEVSDNNCNHNSTDESNVTLSPINSATLNVLQLCHNARVSLEFYNILFALLLKHSSKNQVDITKLPKHDTFLKSLRAWISSPTPVVSQVDKLHVPHFDMLAQIRDLLGSFFFSNLMNDVCVNVDPKQRCHAFAASNHDKHLEMCTQDE
jgi:hypothetical protein